MKKAMVMIIAVLIVFGVSALSWAEDSELADHRISEHNIEVHLDVIGAFGFVIWDTEGGPQVLYPALELDSEGNPRDPDDAGKSRVGAIHYYMTSNRGEPWSMYASSEGCFNPDTGYIADLEMWTFTVPIDANPGKGETRNLKPIPPVPTEIYIAHETEIFCEGVQITSGFAAIGGAAIPYGYHYGNIKLEMISSPTGK